MIRKIRTQRVTPSCRGAEEVCGVKQEGGGIYGTDEREIEYEDALDMALERGGEEPGWCGLISGKP